MCRSLDRLAAYCRGPQLPAGTGDSLLTAIRTWIGLAQDLREAQRGVVPCPRGPHLAATEPFEEPVKGATAKAPGAPPPPPPSKEDEKLPEPSSSHRPKKSPKPSRKGKRRRKEENSPDHEDREVLRQKKARPRFFIQSCSTTSTSSYWP